MKMWQYVYKDIVSVAKYLPWGIVTGILVGILFHGLFKRKQKGVAAIMIFFIYTAVVLMITLFSRESGSSNAVELELFSTWGINARNNAYVVENILLFIPYGFLCCVAFVAARQFFTNTALCALTSLGIEVLQLATGRGCFQSDDILTNVFGGILGFMLFQLYFLIRKRMSHAVK